MKFHELSQKFEFKFDSHRKLKKNYSKLPNFCWRQKIKFSEQIFIPNKIFWFNKNLKNPQETTQQSLFQHNTFFTWMLCFTSPHSIWFKVDVMECVWMFSIYTSFHRCIIKWKLLLEFMFELTLHFIYNKMEIITS